MINNVSIFIGRMSPVHIAHFKIMSTALEQNDHLIVAIGSSGDARTTLNPWTYEERVAMIQTGFDREDLERISFVPLRDYPYDNKKWKNQATSTINHKLAEIGASDAEVTLIGCNKDSTSWYLHYFPKWKLLELDPSVATDQNLIINATDIRSNYLLQGSDILYQYPLSSMVTTRVGSYLTGWQLTPEYQQMRLEMQGNVDYQQKWSSTPYAPTIVTGDSVVLAVKNNIPHVLLITRGKHPGRGLYALPGGHIEQHETLEQSCLRELEEETKLNVGYDISNFIINSKIFDYPRRSQRARVITNAIFIHLPTQLTLPSVTAADDAASVQWVPVQEVGKMRSQFFEDHFHIISSFIDIEES